MRIDGISGAGFQNVGGVPPDLLNQIHALQGALASIRQGYPQHLPSDAEVKGIAQSLKDLIDKYRNQLTPGQLRTLQNAWEPIYDAVYDRTGSFYDCEYKMDTALADLDAVSTALQSPINDDELQVLAKVDQLNYFAQDIARGVDKPPVGDPMRFYQQSLQGTTDLWHLKDLPGLSSVEREHLLACSDAFDAMDKDIRAGKIPNAQDWRAYQASLVDLRKYFP
jgi:hypothetical protein